MGYHQTGNLEFMVGYPLYSNNRFIFMYQLDEGWFIVKQKQNTCVLKPKSVNKRAGVFYGGVVLSTEFFRIEKIRILGYSILNTSQFTFSGSSRQWVNLCEDSRFDFYGFIFRILDRQDRPLLKRVIEYILSRYQKDR